jgi:hypothetical protein
MIFIEHRKNKISDLAQVNLANGVEIDLRSNVSMPGKLHLAHDPWALGDSFEEWLSEYIRLGIKGTIYLNTKEDGLENRAREILASLDFDRFLFLDTSFPTLDRNVQDGLGSQFFVRLSFYEDLENSIKFKGKVNWMWVDCFGKNPLSVELVKKARTHFKLCMVSPELQGGSVGDFERFLPLLPHVDAICTKLWLEWKQRGA